MGRSYSDQGFLFKSYICYYNWPFDLFLNISCLVLASLKMLKKQKTKNKYSYLTQSVISDMNRFLSCLSEFGHIEQLKYWRHTRRHRNIPEVSTHRVFSPTPLDSTDLEPFCPHTQTRTHTTTTTMPPRMFIAQKIISLVISAPL